MRISLNKREEGGALLLVLIICVTTGIVLASYLSLIGSRYKATVRSQCWNLAVPVAEAGIEEAMTHLHVDQDDPALNGWTPGTIAGQRVFSRERRFSDGTYYLVTVYNAENIASNTPIIYSTGFVPAPLDRGSYVSRTVKTRCANPPLLTGALAAVTSLQMNGNGVATDSFNSNDPALSTGGFYDPTKTSTNGDVLSVYGPVDLGNHTLSGDLILGPTATNVSVATGQVQGSIYTDSNASFPDAALPKTSWLSAPSTTSGKTTTYTFGASGDYYIGDSGDIIVQPGVNVRLRVDAKDFKPAKVHIQATNGISGTLIVYQVSGNVTMAGNITVDSGRARNFYYYGLPGVTDITLSGTSSYIGAIYAPSANLTMNGGGNNNGLVGASVTKSVIAINGHYNFHFDEDLLTAGPGRGAVVMHWQEL